MDAMMQFLMEPEIMAMSTFSTGRMFPVFDHSTVMAMIKK
jgi:chromosomal replication initiation ATPase DnaA